MSWAPDYDWAMRARGPRHAGSTTAASTWGTACGCSRWRRTRDPTARLRQWFGKLERLAASPGTAAKLMLMNAEVDVRAVLPSIQAPTLVIHRSGDRYIDVRHSQCLADNIPGARLLMLPGEEAISFGPDRSCCWRRSRSS